MSTVKELWSKHFSDLSEEMEDGTTPQQWIDQGFAPESYYEWSRVGGFNPEKCKELSKEFEPYILSHRISTLEEFDEDFSYSGYTIAYMYCNGDLSIEDVRGLVGNVV